MHNYLVDTIATSAFKYSCCPLKEAHNCLKATRQQIDDILNRRYQSITI